MEKQEDTLQPFDLHTRVHLTELYVSFLSSRQPLKQNLLHTIAFVTVQGHIKCYGVAERHVSIRQLLSSSKNSNYNR